MKRLSTQSRIIAWLLAFLAGYVDAAGFMASGGFFVSFMSGNTTRLGAGTWISGDDVALAASLLASFVCGVMGASLLRRRAKLHGQSAITASVAAALLMAVLLHNAGYLIASLLLTAVSMGALNGVFERDGEVAVGLTYMTGNLVKFGQKLAQAIAGPWQTEWIAFLGLWLSLAVGAIMGALSWQLFDVKSLGIAGLVALLISLWLRLQPLPH